MCYHKVQTDFYMSFKKLLCGLLIVSLFFVRSFQGEHFTLKKKKICSDMGIKQDFSVEYKKIHKTLGFYLFSRFKLWFVVFLFTLNSVGSFPMIKKSLLRRWFVHTGIITAVHTKLYWKILESVSWQKSFWYMVWFTQTKTIHSLFYLKQWIEV